ncbi:MAG: hypothetical protein ACJAY8_000456 [Sphingobacteriales bacterium]|jgi:hypothetical protein
MSFGGSVSAMISSLKMNSRKRKTIFDKGHSAGRMNSNQNNLSQKTASREELNQIKRKLTLENQKRRRKMVVLALLIIGFLLVILFGLF